MVEIAAKGKVQISVTGNGGYLVRFTPYNTIDSDKFLTVREDNLELAMNVMVEKVRGQTIFTL
jgi:hypothetical protein